MFWINYNTLVCVMKRSEVDILFYECRKKFICVVDTYKSWGVIITGGLSVTVSFKYWIGLNDLVF
jgi:hypothetical protein